MKAERHSHLPFNHNGHIIDQIICTDHMDLIIIISEPSFQLIFDKRPLYEKYRHIQQILRRDGFFPGQLRVFADQHAPPFLPPETDEIIFRDIHRLRQQSDIQQSFIQPVFYIICVCRIQIVPDHGVCISEPFHNICQFLHAVCLPASNRNVSREFFLTVPELIFRLVHKLDDLLSSALQKHPVLCQTDAVVAPFK